MENHSVEVLDLAKRRRVAEIGGLTEPQGLAYAPAKDVIFVASRGDGTLRSFDAQTLQPGPWVDLGRNSDNVRFDAASQTIYVGSGGEPGAGALSAIDLKSLLPTAKGGIAAPPRSPADLLSTPPRQADWRAQIAFPSHPESFQISGDTVFVNVPDEHVVNVIGSDGGKMEIVKSWPVPAQKNFAMVADVAHGRVFVIARKPALLLTYDATSGALLGQTPCVGDCDDAYFDAATHKLLLIGGEEGAVDVFDATPGQLPRRLERVPTGAHARTGYFVPSRSVLAVAVPHIGPQKAKVLLFRVK